MATSVVIFIIVATVALAFFGIRYRRRRRCLVQEEQTKDRETRENARHISVLGLRTSKEGPVNLNGHQGLPVRTMSVLSTRRLRVNDIGKNVFQSSLSSAAPTRNTPFPQPIAPWEADPFAVADTSRLSLPMSDTINTSALPLHSEIVQPQPPPHSRQSTVRAGRPPSYEGFGDGRCIDLDSTTLKSRSSEY